jgi:hypothetical protein
LASNYIRFSTLHWLFYHYELHIQSCNGGQLNMLRNIKRNILHNELTHRKVVGRAQKVCDIRPKLLKYSYIQVFMTIIFPTQATPP